MKNKVSQFLQDSDGQPSSKRKYGARLINSGILMAFGLFAYCFYKTPESKIPLDIIITLISSGSLLLGAGSVLEKFAHKKN